MGCYAELCCNKSFPHKATYSKLINASTVLTNFKSLPDRPTPSNIQALQCLLLLDVKYHGQHIDRGTNELLHSDTK